MISRMLVRAGCVFFAMGGLVAAQEKPLEFFQSEVGAVVRLKEPDRTIEKVAGIAEAISPGLGNQVQKNAQGLGQLISNPELSGVDQTKDWYIGIYAQGEDEPLVVFAIPAIDVDEMKEALGEKSSVVKGKYVLYAEGEDDLPLAESADESISGKLTGKSAGVFDRGDLSVFLNLDHLTTVYRSQIDAGYDQVVQQLNNLKFQVPQTPGMNLGAVFDMYAKMAEGALQGINDTSSMTLAVILGEETISIEEFTAFHPTSASGESWSKAPTSKLEAIEKMPAEASIFYAANLTALDSFINWSMELSTTMVEDENLKKAFESLAKDIDGVKFGTITGAMSLGPAEEGMLRYVTVVDVEPVQKMREISAKYADAFKEMKLQGLTQTTVLEKDAETYGKYKADVVTVKQTYDESVPGLEMNQHVQEVMFGSEGIVSRNVYMEKSYLSSVGGGVDAAKAALEAYQGSGGNGLADYRSELISPANVQFLMDIPGLAAAGLKGAESIPGNPLAGLAEALDGLNLEKSYIGFSLASGDNGIHCKTDVPVKQVQGIVKLVTMIGASQAGRGGGF